jgi:hypothetical protein
MITTERLNRGEGKLVEYNHEIGLRKRTLKVRRWHWKRDFLMMRKNFERLSSPCRR